MPTRSPIAVVGMSCLFPGSVNKTGFWRDILAGKDLTADVPASHWLIEDYYDADPTVPDKTYAKRGAFLDDIPFDPMAFGVPPSIVPQTDTSQLLALIVAKQVLQDASRGQFENMDKERMGIVLGVTSGQELMGSMASRLQRPIWTKAMREAGLPESKVTELCERMSSEYTDWGESNFPGLLGNVVAGRVANRLDLGGFNCVTDAACASSLSALQMAMHSLWLEESDVVIAGGVDTMNDIFMYMCFSKTPALSMTGDCRPFSADGDGTLLGEGLAMMALKRLEDAERDGDPIYSVIRGIGGSSDGKSKSVYAPVSAGQAKSIRRAYASAGMDPQTVELVEAHGTGTVAGDAAEFGGLRLVFGDEGPQRIALGSVKSQIGHTKSTAGAAGMFKAVLALHSKVLPPTIKVDSPNPKMDIENSPFYLSTRARPWIRGSDHPRRAGVSAFGFGGSNFHVAVEEYTGALTADRVRSLPAELVVLTADSIADLQASVADALTLASEDGGLAFLAGSSQNNADTQQAHRVALTATDEADLFAKLTTVQAHLKSSPAEALSTPNGVYIAHGEAAGDVGFVFPGQGSQYVDMGAALAMHMDSARAVWDRAQDIEMGDTKLAEVAFPMPVFGKEAEAAQASRLTATEWAQPAIGAASLALLAVLREVGLTPTMVAGHSFGEVTALAAAGAFDEETALRIARRRGELMRDAAQADGSMTAAKAEIDAVRAAVGGIDVVVANHNGPTQVVLSGPTAGIELAETALQAAGIAFKRLAVATAFHSSVVAASADPFEAFLHEQDLREPTLPVLAHATAEPYGDDVASALGGAIAQSVRFVDQVEAMYASGIRTFVEVGPGSVLTRLVGRILKGRPHVAIDTDRKGRNAMVSLLDGLARMVAAGAALDLTGTWMAFETPVDPRTVAKSKFTLSLNGANYGKPYPPKGGAAALPKPNPEVVERPAVVAPAPQVAAAAPRPSAAVAAPAVVAAPQASARVDVATAGLSAPRVESRPVAASIDGSVASLVAEAQKRTADAHTAYQRSMADAHVAFLATMQNAVSALTGSTSLVGHQPSAVHTAALAVPVPAPIMAAAPVVAAPVVAAPVVAAPVVVAPVVAAPVPVAAPVAVAAVVPQRDLKALVLAVVAESTGYPVEMLEPSMSLESDLGIDSIKRVEILSAVQKAAPELPEVDTGALASLDTLQQVIDHLAANAPVASHAAPAAAVPQRDLKALVLAVVAESTGYPVDMLEPSMSLESDLGIDSIKRVEILSAVQKAAPELPEVDTGALASLDTLQQVIDHLAANAPVATHAAPAAAVPQRDLKALVLAVVADSTGYPVDMLEPSMSLESDLGIDSIKRVEILSAVQKAAPELPEVDTGALASLDTLQQVIDHLATDGPASAAPVTELQAKVTASAPEIGHFATRLVDAPVSNLKRPGLQGRIRITTHAADLASGLATALTELGYDAATVETIDENTDVAIFTGGLVRTPTAAASVDLHTAALLAAKTVSSTGSLITLQATGGDFGLSGHANGWSAGVTGLIKTAAIEWPGRLVKAIDVDRDDVVSAVVSELRYGGPELEVGLRADGTRVTLESVAVAERVRRVKLDSNDVVVVSGGARGVTAACVIALATQTRSKFVLLGRSALTDDAYPGITDDAGLKHAVLQAAKAAGEAVKPADIGRRVRNILASREVNETLGAIRKAGGEAMYCVADVSDAEAVASAVSQGRKAFGTISGVIHGAGVLADRFIADKTEEQARFVLGVKLLGLEALLSAVGDDALKVLAVFSSVAGRAGNRGQSDYAMANEVLNRVASQYAAAHANTVVRSIGWGPWAGGMVDASLKARFDAAGVALVGLQDGARRFVDELTPGGDVELVIGGAPSDGALLADDRPASAVFNVRVDKASHPWLVDHTITDVPVLPVVMTLEWFVRAAKAFRPELTVSAVEDVKVRRGVTLPHFYNGGDVFTLDISEAGPGQLAVSLTSADPRAPGGRAKHYDATVAVQPEPEERPKNAVAPSLDLAAWTDTIYGDVLFHGPDFQVITGLDGVADNAIQGTLDGVVAKNWPSGFHTDAAALDGGIQLAVLWNKHAQGGAFLPTGIRRYVPHDPVVSGPIRCTVRPIAQGNDAAVSDIEFVGLNGEPIASLQGVQTNRRPNGL
jgi:acyl transferase domain-containing protein/acyl carrier protein/NADP-dependent 3-hydroxy acid dehydrogenase YdfG